MVIWKSVIGPYGPQEIEVPRGSQFLSCQPQHDNISVWYLCDPRMPIMEKFVVEGFVTGAQGPENGSHFLGTFQFEGGSFVKHWFVRRA